MNRIEELTLKLADGELSETEAFELGGLLAKDPAARLTHLRLLEIEGGLRSRHSPADLAPAIIARIKADGVAKLSERVLDRIKADVASRVLPFPSPGAVRSEKGVEVTPCRWRKGRVTLALAASVALLVELGVWFFSPTMGEPVLAEAKGADVSIERGTEYVPGADGTRLQATDVLRVGTNASATITFGPETTRLELSAATELKLESWSGGKHFALHAGQLEASVAPQRPFRPMKVVTPQAEARVLGTKFTLTATTNATRLDVAQGMVRFSRTSDGAVVQVAGEQFAIAAAGYELAALPKTGSILREYWTNIPGANFVTLLITNSNFPDRPSGREFLDTFEAPADWSDNFGDRLRGYLIPPQTGDYSLWIAGNDACELWLSRDSSPENKVQVALTKGTAPREWSKSPSQHSATLSLTTGRLYYIEAIRKCGVGDDHLAVAWEPPGGQREIIPGRYLAPFQANPRKKTL